MTEPDKNKECTPHMFYDSSIGLAVSWEEKPEEAAGKTTSAISPEELTRRQQAVAISGGWVFLTGDSRSEPGA